MPEILYFPYYGPNRHSDQRVVECRMNFSQDKPDEFPQSAEDIRNVLVRNGIIDAKERFPLQATGRDRIEWYSSLFVQTALLLQQKAGHQVTFFSVSPEPVKKRSIALLEHEDSESAQAAIGIAVEVFSGKPEALNGKHDQFLAFARQRALSLETRAIIRQTKRRKIPFLQLDRAPLTGCINTGIRVRRNGLLSLGQGVNSQILDGTFCVSRASEKTSALLRNSGERLALLKQIQIPVVPAQAQARNAHAYLHMLVINGKVTASRRLPGNVEKPVKKVHESLKQQALSIAQAVDNAPFLITYRTADVNRPSIQGEGIVGFELAPDLGRLYGPDGKENSMLDIAAGNLLDWLFPTPAAARIPVVAITGTNGKTTTSRMIRHIFNHSGYKTGLVCTDGIFLNQQQVSDEDNSTFMGHARVLTSKQVTAAVLETHHRGIAVHGFAFNTCDVAVCLNVTEEHLAVGEIETVAEMVTIKRALVERARHVAILFADDSNCLGMIKHTSSERVCLVSLNQGVEHLREFDAGPAAGFCVLELLDEHQWIVFYDDQSRLPVMPVNEIPATLDGLARVNVSNAMHAIAASYYSDVGITHIRSALRQFRADQQFSPGRMNNMEGLPFRAVMDFAHNPDGMKKICEFADRQKVKGRKVIAFAGMSGRPDDLNRKVAKTVAGHFDFYFCKDYEPSKPPKRRYTGPFMQSVLLEAGVPKESTRVLTFGQDVVFEILDSCEPDDFLLFMVGHAESGKLPKYVENYRALHGGGSLSEG